MTASRHNSTTKSEDVTTGPSFDASRSESDRLNRVVSTVDEFEEVVSNSLPVLLDRASSCTKRYLRETGQWKDDVAHEKFVLRWAAEYLEEFLVCGPEEVPCRPLFLLDSVVARQHSKPQPFCYHPDLLTPLGRFIDGVLAHATLSRDALIALYHHCYGLTPRHVIAVLGLDVSESQRIYKNCRRWRDSGWARAMDELGITEDELASFERQQAEDRDRFNGEASRLVRFAQNHYRRSEPLHYRCLSTAQWHDMFQQGYGNDYRMWHLALCLDCLRIAWDWADISTTAGEKPRVDLHIRP